MERVSLGWVAFLCIHLALGGGVVAVCLLFGERRREVLWRAALALALAGGLLVSLEGWLGQGGLSPRHITMLQEGRTGRNVGVLYAEGIHAGPLFRWLSRELSRHGADTAVHLVEANLRVSTVVVAGYLALGSMLVPSSVLGVCLAALVLVGTLARHSVFSPTPAVWLALYVLVATLALAALTDASEPRRCARRRAAFGLLALSCACAAAVRSEYAVMGLLACAVGALRALGWEGAARERLLLAVDRLGRVGSWSILLAAGTAGVIAHALKVLPSGEVHWAAAAASPTDFSGLYLPVHLAPYWLLGPIVLVVLGLFDSVRRPIATAGLGFGLLFVHELYIEASYGERYEVFRYLTLVEGPLLVLALLGARALDRWTSCWPPGHRSLLAAGLVAASVQPLWTDLTVGTDVLAEGARPSFMRPEPAVAGLLDRDPQLEVRTLVEAVHARPECVFVTRVLRAEKTGAGQGDYATEWLLFGGPQHYIVRADGAEALDRVVRERASHAGCVQYYRGLDCHLDGRDVCAADVATRRPIWSVRRSSRPYCDPAEYGELAPTIELAFYDLAPR